MVRIMTLLIALLLPFTLLAQGNDEQPPDYRVQVFGYEISDDRRQIIINFGVSNIGGASDEYASVLLTDLITGDIVVIESDLVEPLSGGGDTNSDLSIAFLIEAFQSGSNQVFEVAVGVDEIESASSDTIFNNTQSISVQIPDYELVITQPDDTEAPPPPQADASTIFTIPVLDVEIDTSDPQDMRLLAGIIMSALFMLLIVYTILRLLFRRYPRFGNWQPPYATMPPLDPNSTFGRRQMWQQHAQNNIVPAPCQMGSVHARKMLQGMDNLYLSGWKVMSIRMTQYDMYGRVARSETLANGGAVNRLNRAVRRAHRISPEKLPRRVRPIARSLARSFRKKLSKRSARLPVALDIRIRGKHGEVRIVFELFECRSGQPYLLDSWEPEMTVLGKAIYESYTYTIYGQSGGESYQEYRKRLPDEIERALVDLLKTAHTQLPQQSSSTPHTTPAANTATMQAVNSADTQTP